MAVDDKLCVKGKTLTTLVPGLQTETLSSPGVFAYEQVAGTLGRFAIWLCRVVYSQQSCLIQNWTRLGALQARIVSTKSYVAKVVLARVYVKRRNMHFKEYSILLSRYTYVKSVPKRKFAMMMCVPTPAFSEVLSLTPTHFGAIFYHKNTRLQNGEQICIVRFTGPRQIFVAVVWSNPDLRLQK